jgi:hypothetical protein
MGNAPSGVALADAVVRPGGGGGHHFLLLSAFSAFYTDRRG